MSDLSFGIIGTGSAAESHASAICRQPSASLTAVRSRRIEKAREFASRHGSITAYEEVEYLLENRDVDGVVVTSGLDERAECIRLAVRSGRPVIASSPIARSYHEAMQLAALSEEEGALITPFVTRRYSCGIRFIRNAIDEGRLGRLMNVSVSYMFDKSTSSYEADAESGSLIMKDGFEALDVMLFLIGKPRMLSSFSGNIAARSDAEDIFTVSFVAGSAAHGSLSLIASSSASSFSVSAVGSEGCCRYENGRLSCMFRNGERIEISDDACGIDAFYSDYISSLFSGTEAVSKLEDGLLALRVAEAIISASKRIDF